MPRHSPVTSAERAELRRLYLAATAGRWEATRLPRGPAPVAAVRPDESRADVATFSRETDALLAAAARNALPRLFAEIDALRAKTRGVPLIGTVR